MKTKHLRKGIMIFFQACEGAQNHVEKPRQEFECIFQKIKKNRIFSKSDFLQVNRSHFSISFKLHTSSINTLLYS